jgi:hypothetical protein
LLTILLTIFVRERLMIVSRIVSKEPVENGRVLLPADGDDDADDLFPLCS